MTIERLDYELPESVEQWGWKYHHLDYELVNHDFKIITQPNQPSEGVRVAMIEQNGAPIELIEFEKLVQND